MIFNKKILPMSLAMSSLIMLSACGGGDDGATTQKQGQFVDSAVQGLDVYQDGKKISTTDKNGYFNFVNETPVTFKIGKLVIGSAVPKLATNKPMTPFDLSDNKPILILQTLQSLDSDGNTANGITITERAKQIISETFGTETNIAEIPSSNNNEVKIEDVIAPGLQEALEITELVSEVAAVKHFKQTMSEFKKPDSDYSLSGVWTNGCDSIPGSKESYKDYFTIIEPDDAHYELTAIVETTYLNDNCDGEPAVVIDEFDPNDDNITSRENLDVSFLNNDVVIIVETTEDDGDLYTDVVKLSRVKQSDVPSITHTSYEDVNYDDLKPEIDDEAVKD